MKRRSIICFVTTTLLGLAAVNSFGQAITPGPPNYTPTVVTYDFKDYKPYVNDEQTNTYDAAGDVIKSQSLVWVYLPVGTYTVTARLTVQKKGSSGGWQTIGQTDVPHQTVNSNGQWGTIQITMSATIPAELNNHRTIATMGAVQGENENRKVEIHNYRHTSDPTPPGGGSGI